jgi:hypothetical protein
MISSPQVADDGAVAKIMLAAGFVMDGNMWRLQVS